MGHGPDSARVGIQKYLQRHNLTEALIEAMAVEKDAVAASLIHATYGKQAADADLPYPTIVHDVLHLIKAQGVLLKTWTKRIPKNAAVLVVFGSPCSDFTIIGRFFGALGWHGSRSSLLFTAALIIFLIETFRPELEIIPIGEQAGSTRIHFSKLFHTIFRLPQTGVLLVNTKDYTPWNRERLVYSPFQSTGRRGALDIVTNAIEPGWIKICANLPAMMLAQSPMPDEESPGDFPVLSPYQSHPNFLLYDTILHPIPADILFEPILPPHVFVSLTFIIDQAKLGKVLRAKREEFDPQARPFCLFCREI